ncbi:peptidase domain-containing ABC transporter [Paraferrimonas sedimenticola]|uniref:ABC transporter n=1 Tax=Paraferrimonas sedimenticola TaxID=375674 RepID=A0AA37RX42_9GAMM|nr:peptidase domain-containing ABC transporter [Paraferrimonas sedimenticola]GLP96888.1 ABC transporter [Paraferrimonas sedimenticola]
MTQTATINPVGSSSSAATTPQVDPKSLLNFGGRKRLKLIRQNEISECGLACIAMVADYHGNGIGLAQLRQKLPTGLSGANLKQLIELAADIGLSSRPLKCPLDQLEQLQLPAILHWDMNHFVVLAKVRGSKASIFDPANGKLELSVNELASHFTGIALELSPAKDFQTQAAAPSLSWRQLWSQLDGLGLSLAKLIALSLLLQLLALLGPYYMQWVVDQVLIAQDRPLLMVLAIGFGLVAAISSLAHWLRSYLVLRVSAVFNLSLGRNLLRHMLRLPMSFFFARHTGDILSRFQSLQQVRERLTTGVSETLVDGVMSLAILAFMLMYSIKLTLVVLAAVAIYSLLRVFSYRALRRAQDAQIRASASEQSHLLESLKTMQSLKLLGQEPQRHAQWQNRYADVINADIRLGKLNINYATANKFLFGIENVLVVYLAAQLAMGGMFSVGMLLAFMAYKTQLVERVAGLIEQLVQFRMLKLHLERISDIALADEEANLDGSGSAAVTPNKAVEVTLENVCFRYPGQSEWLLKNINLRLKPGSATAIAGSSGSGKSTLIKIILGLLVPSEGRVLIDGKDIRDIGLRAYRRQIAAVMQDDQLISGTLIDNICAGEPTPDIQRATQAIEQASLTSTIAQLGLGLNSLVGELGNQLSGGQTQRLFMARALYRQPKLLVLDEATSHLDKDNEQSIVESLSTLSMTRVSVAHRQSTLDAAEQVWLLKDGGLKPVPAGQC